MEIKEQVVFQARKASKASRKLSGIATDVKNKALAAIAEKLVQAKDEIIRANNIDMERGREKGLSKALLDRLELNEKRIEGMAEGLKELVKLEDPVGEVIKMWKRPNGLQIGQMRVPLGVIGMIYEARPNVTVDAAGLCLKTGNAVILRGGSEAINSNKILARIIEDTAVAAGLPEGCVQLIQTTDRKAVKVLFNLTEYLDVLIPRGGAGLINRVIAEAKVPVIQTGVGNCHVYVDSEADLDMALDIVFNAKTSRPAVCNAAESLLVHRQVADEFLPELYKLFRENNVELRGCENTRAILPGIKKAVDDDWSREYLDYIMAVKIVDSFDKAVEHINTYGTKHSEAIITENYTRAHRFLQEIDAAAVYVNASTRFTDGGQFGLGAEIGISTQKLHARGPMGLEELTTTKYIIFGQGQIRE
ncbi:glutamate-5-semialdehyde dehydrogenase [Halothermothrix orenii]|uniref:Gamma-glutamyl phosphate reductase n=1 Tax=Halothermothrix orenii (strain H 168 / OCM 544 / DSM 9562) TaxID=373903 RepID=PROA_HALOH|nr:glutamate-5-semialdehyde dehydrogenase [Halothermothrix orenii]B8D0Y6.1 RecName: Full=Gamma-glutamyl phosphate reductase; Short=GPR; AltName: Full=Glutamate-5-semialdehyde dehydrogenase; AltName: Full=Glutamyl-gamma-semialdehyde dehydrogenase; Short=GSA dehydrogenase [Halothermothrix orenii H 168]ACL68955.1 gamma-glutamyl phosphate reductase [Halothermothrix orenii H 168]